MSRHEKLGLYRKAVPLSEAWLRFARQEHLSALGKMKGFFETFSNSAQSNPQDSRRGTTLFKALNAAFAAKSKRDVLLNDMREHLLEEIFNSQLTALGYRQRPSKSHYPVEIDAQFFEYADAKWNDCTVEWEGKVYSGVKVYDPTTVERRQSRPLKGSIAAIDSAIRELKLENSEFCNLPRQKACELIRGKLVAPDIKGNGLSDQNLSKRILIYCPKREIRK